MTGAKCAIRWIHLHLMLSSAFIALACVVQCAASVGAAQLTEQRGNLVLSERVPLQDPVGVRPEHHTQICGELIEAKTSLQTPVADHTGLHARLTWRHHVNVQLSWSGPSLQILFCTWRA